MKKKLDIKKIKNREISKKELMENEKEYKRNKLIFCIIPSVLIVLIIIFYILFRIHLLLIPFAIFFLMFLYGWDSNQRTCNKCKKWNSLIWIDSKIILRKTKVKKKILNKEYEKNKKEKINVSTGKCKNCGEEITTEKSKIL